MSRWIDGQVPAALAVPALALAGLAGCSSTSVLDLEVGDCLESDAFAGSEISDIATISCAEPHDAEIYSAMELPEGDYPGVEAVRSEAEDYCLPAFDDFAGIGYLDSELVVYPLFPTEGSWNEQDDREILCIVVAPEDVTGTLEGAAR